MNKKKDVEDIKVDKVEKVDEVEEEKSESSELDECQQKVQSLENIAKRALADYQNLEKRVKEEKIEWILGANRQLLLRLLPVLDTLYLASEHVENQGLKLSIKMFEDVLKNEGVEKIETEGKDFDPIFMECVVTEDGGEGKVLSEIRAGYKIGDRILRPAQVKVGKGK